MKRSAPTPENTSNRQTIRLLLHCEDGTVPYMTPSMLKKYLPPSDDLWLGIAVRDSCVKPQFKPQKNPNDKHKPSGYTFGFKGLDSFLLPYNRVTVPSFNLLNDAAAHGNSDNVVSATNTYVQVWTPHGRHKLSPSLYSECARGLHSQATVPLYDMAMGTESDKRKQNATRRNAAWLDEYVAENEPNGSPNIWAPVVLGLDTTDKEPTVTPSKEEVNEDRRERIICLDGLAFIGQTEGIDLAAQLRPRLDASDELPPTIALLSTKSILEFMEAARAGANMVGTSLPAVWAKGKRALVVSFDIHDGSKKRMKAAKEMNEESFDNNLDTDGCIDMSDERYARDARPLTPGCSCMSCSNSHSRAYIHHLVKAKELLAEILLFSHNLCHLQRLCRALSAGRDETYNAVKAQIIPN